MNNYEIRDITKDKNLIKSLLNKLDLQYEEDIEYSAGIFVKNKLVGTGSFSNKIIKCIGITPEFQESGLLSKLLSHLIQKEYEGGRDHLFLFTKPENSDIFQNLGFKEIERVEHFFALLEFGSQNIENYQQSLKRFKKNGKNGGIVVNCNPFTLGHLYLIERASKMVDNLYIFVVEEDRSLFPFKIRYRLVKDGTSHLENVLVLKGGEYIISSSTFPTYFLKNEKNLHIVKAQTTLDLKIFGRYIASALDIKYRFVGTEPYCKTTKTYNETMKNILPKYGITLVEIERKKEGEEYISASRVRQLIRENKMDILYKYLPPVTLNFLNSKESKDIIEKIRGSNTRH